MATATLLVSTMAYFGAGVGVLAIVVIIAVVILGGGDKPRGSKVGQVPEAEEKPAEPEEKPAEPEEKAEEEAPEPEKAPGAKPDKPPTLEVEALSPSATGEAPMLAADDDGLKMATDEMPRIGTAEMPQLEAAESSGPAQYRTPAAQELSAAIASGDCPKCNAPTFVGSEDPEEVGTDGVSMFKLTGRCGACGHKAEIIDMRVG